jgi:hypothetical protein
VRFLVREKKNVFVGSLLSNFFAGKVVTFSGVPPLDQSNNSGKVTSSL